MSDNENRQWFEQSDKDRERRRSRTGGKKPASGAPKAPADEARKKRSAQRGHDPAGKHLPKPQQPKPGQPKSDRPVQGKQGQPRPGQPKPSQNKQGQRPQQGGKPKADAVRKDGRPNSGKGRPVKVRSLSRSAEASRRRSLSLRSR